MKGITIIVIASLLFTPLVARAQQTLSSNAELEAYKQLAAGMPLGSRVKVQTRDGKRMTATLMSVTDAAIVVKRESRVPEPAVSIAFADLTRLHLEEKSGFSMGKALGIGLAAGVGAILTLFAIAVSIDD
jgi:hypothetical protein